MKNDAIIRNIKKDLIACRDLEYKKGSKNFFKEDIDLIGVRAADTRRIAKEYYKEVKDLSKKELFSLCDELLMNAKIEQRTVAFDWLRRSEDLLEEKDFFVFEAWLEGYVSNWAHCDDFCTHAFGSLLHKFPTLLPKVVAWTKSDNRWMRRASAVVMIYPIKRREKKWLRDSFAIADRLLLDQDDLVQKGYGWMLKEAANFWEKEVFDFVMKRKNVMPRTSLRYAIEKMPRNKKAKAMKR